MSKNRLNLSSYGKAFRPIRVQDSGSPPPLEMSHNYEKQKIDSGMIKIVETWINETLSDAEHMDIPGVLLKPENKNPINRYGIDKLSLTNAGIPTEMVDRIFRGLFVYSTGFYEVMNKALAHTKGKYQVITCLWKVYGVLLEYCCASDYKMLINEMSKQHMDELCETEKKYQNIISIGASDK